MRWIVFYAPLLINKVTGFIGEFGIGSEQLIWWV
jgi:hypothetical protein